MCGADAPNRLLILSRPGSPPRVRSRLGLQPSRTSPERITSACAEQTRDGERNDRILGDHLRVCGADGGPVRRVVRWTGSPPRVRSRPAKIADGVIPTGITSACAEQTNWVSNWSIPTMDHLRVCGADVMV